MDTLLKKAIIISILFGILSGAVTTIIIQKITNNENNLIKEFYLVENAVHVSPHSIRKSMDKGENNFILVDLRSQEEYEKEHIIGAVNIPAYKDPDTSAYGDVDRIVNSFNDLKTKNQNKNLIVYCYSIPCMTGRKIGKLLVGNNIYVKHLGIGWNEWRYDWNSWNHEHEWNITSVKDYIAVGKEPGTPKINLTSKACPIEGALGC